MLEEVESLGGLQAASASSVARLLHDLQQGTDAPLMRVASRVQLVRYPLPQPDGRARHRGAFLLTERLADLRTADPQILDDRARALLALQIAQFLHKDAPASTALVTRVMRTVPALHLRTVQDTHVLLESLTRGDDSSISRSGGRGNSVRWQVTTELVHCWLEWVMATAETYRNTLATRTSVGATGAASLAEVVAKLVTVCSVAQTSAMWPKGRPVTARELNTRMQQALLARDAEDPVYALALTLQAGRRGLNAVCDDAARPEFGGGGPRRKPLLRAVRATETAQHAYAPVSLPQSHAEAWAEWQALQTRGATARVNALHEEWEGAAAAAAAYSCPVVQAIVATRRVIVAAHADVMVASSQRLVDRAVGISASLHDHVQKRHVLLRVMRGEWPAESALKTEARRRLRPLAVDLADVVASPRATMSNEEYSRLLPTTITDGQVPSVVAAGATRVRRVAGPTRGTSRVGSGRADTYRLDWGDAVMDAAEQANLPGLASLLAARQLLGRHVVHPRLVRQLVSSKDPLVRDAGLAALVLVGDTAHLARELRRMVKSRRGLDDARVAITVVALAFWLDYDTRRLIVERGRAHPSQAVQRATEKVRRGTRQSPRHKDR